MQKPYPETARFPCNPNGPGARSASPPISAHGVRPGDIDIVAAIGDSLTAGNGMCFECSVMPATSFYLFENQLIRHYFVISLQFVWLQVQWPQMYYKLLSRTKEFHGVSVSGITFFSILLIHLLSDKTYQRSIVYDNLCS